MIDATSATTEAGRVITFYSYKGGTGRSMALANIAYLLREDSPAGKRLAAGGQVVAIDWDLEAPGLHRYFDVLRPDREAPLGDGLIELFNKLRESVTEQPSQSPEATEEERARRLVAELDLAPYLKLTTVPGLWFIPAGSFDASYPARVTGFDWQELHRQRPELITAFSRRLAKEYAYVLIDSRTGISDTSGICTMLMPDVLVTVFTPNMQSVSGVRDVINAATAFRKRSADVRPLTVFPLPSRIELARTSLLELWRNGGTSEIRGYQPEFEALLGEVYGLSDCDLTAYFNDVQIQHVPDYAYGEQLASHIEANDSRLSLRRSYENFTVWLLDTGAPWLDPQVVKAERRVRGLCEAASNALASQALDEATKLLMRAADEPNSARTNVTPELCRALANLGEAQALQSLLSAAEETFRCASELAEQGGLNALELTAYLERRADLLAALGRQAEAVELLRQVVAHREGLLGRTHHAVAEAYEKLGSALGAVGRFNDGVAALKHGLEIRVVAVGDRDPSVAESLERLAEAVARTGALSESEKYLLKALDVTPDASERGRSRIFNRLGMLHMEAGDVERAEQYFRQSIESSVPPNMSSYLSSSGTASSTSGTAPSNSGTAADSFDGLGRIALIRGDFSIARDHFEHAEALREEALGPEHPATLRTALNLGDLAFAEGDLTRAERQYSRVVRPSQRAADNPLAGEALERLGGVAASRHDYAQARSAFEEALAVNERLGDQAAVARGYHQLGVLVQEQGEYKSAEGFYRRSLEINERFGDQAAVARGYHQLGVLAQEQGEYKSAEGFYRRSLEINERLGNQAAVARGYHQLGELAQEQKDYDAAGQYYRESLNIAGQLGNQAATATAFTAMAMLLAEWGRDTEALRFELLALSTWEQMGSVQVWKSLHRLLALRSKLGSEAFTKIVDRSEGSISTGRLAQMLDQIETSDGSPEPHSC